MRVEAPPDSWRRSPRRPSPPKDLRPPLEGLKTLSRESWRRGSFGRSPLVRKELASNEILLVTAVPRRLGDDYQQLCLPGLSQFAVTVLRGAAIQVRRCYCGVTENEFAVPSSEQLQTGGFRKRFRGRGHLVSAESGIELGGNQVCRS